MGGDATVRVPSKRVCRGDGGISEDVFRVCYRKVRPPKFMSPGRHTYDHKSVGHMGDLKQAVFTHKVRATGSG